MDYHTILTNEQNSSDITHLQRLLPTLFCNDKNTVMAQAIVSFAYGILLSPWSQGLFFLIISIIIYEILYYVFTHGNPRYYQVFTRCGVICAAIAGYIIGRTICNCDILYEGVPDIPWKK